ncbi:DJ-1/PfpI family protein [Propionibacteriaceae bacterium Y2011]|uniref:DJ-1/PfpI family protein n=1 Tax=Microlunatus sp. Y2014 TaxID=3418488 RepID=UPI003B4A436E
MNEVVIHATPGLDEQLLAPLLRAHDLTNPEMPVSYVGSSTEPVTTTGGQLTPSRTVAEVDPDRVEVLVLAGGEGWHDDHDEVLALAKTLLRNGRPVGAIGTAVIGLARVGSLDEVPHTTDSPAMLAEVDYPGDGRYIDGAAMGSGDVVTAGSDAPAEFAREVARRLQWFADEASLDAWFADVTATA